MAQCTQSRGFDDDVILSRSPIVSMWVIHSAFSGEIVYLSIVYCLHNYDDADCRENGGKQINHP